MKKDELAKSQLVQGSSTETARLGQLHHRVVAEGGGGGDKDKPGGGGQKGEHLVVQAQGRRSEQVQIIDVQDITQQIIVQIADREQQRAKETGDKHTQDLPF